MKSQHVVTRVITLELTEQDAYQLKLLLKNYEREVTKLLPEGDELEHGSGVFIKQLLSALNHNVDYEDET